MAQTKSSGIILIGLLVMVMLATLVLNIPINGAKTKHNEASMVRTLHKDGMCEGTELWFSPSRGTLLILCGVPDTRQWGGLVYRVTENYGTILLGEDAYEVTVFVSSREYWDGVLARDGYMPLAIFPDLERKFRELYK